MEAKVKELTQQLAEVHAALEKVFAHRQATKDTIAAKEAAENQVVVLIEKSRKVNTFRYQELFPRNAEINNLKV